MKLISIEGIDGSGKTTLINALKEAGYTVFKEIPKDLKDNQKDTLGYSIRQLLQNHKSDTDDFRFMLANKYVKLRQEYQDEIEVLLSRGDVIMDRGILSTIVYGYTPNEENNTSLAQANFKTRVPDLTILLDVDLETALLRLDMRQDSKPEAYKREASIIKNQAVYSLLANRYKKELNIVNVNASKDAKSVLQDVLSLLRN